MMWSIAAMSIMDESMQSHDAKARGSALPACEAAF